MYALGNKKAFQSKAKRLLSQVNNFEQFHSDDMDPPPTTVKRQTPPNTLP